MKLHKKLISFLKKGSIPYILEENKNEIRLEFLQSTINEKWITNVIIQINKKWNRCYIHTGQALDINEGTERYIKALKICNDINKSYGKGNEIYAYIIDKGTVCITSEYIYNNLNLEQLIFKISDQLTLIQYEIFIKSDLSSEND